MCIQVAREAKKMPTAFFTFRRTLSELISIKDRENLEAITKGISLEFDREYQESDLHFGKPVLGCDIPVTLLSLLHQDVNHIFRGQEWERL